MGQWSWGRSHGRNNIAGPKPSQRRHCCANWLKSWQSLGAAAKLHRVQTNHQIERLEDLLAECWSAYQRFAGQRFVVRPSIPILFFGDSRRYFGSGLKVVTVGLNPSDSEFPKKDPFLRFPKARDLGENEKCRTLSLHVESLNDYFRTEPYTRWFRNLEPILNGLDSSYYDRHANSAIHTDLCSPIATEPTWSGLRKDEQEQLELSGFKIWHTLIGILDPDVILISVAKRYVARIEFSLLDPPQVIWELERKNPYQAVGSRLLVSPTKQCLLVFGRARQVRRSKQYRTKINGSWEFQSRNISMPLQCELCFVQFIHPGKEHRPGSDGFMDWNRKDHKRKFLEVDGQCIRRRREFRGPMRFWGEWEPQSQAVGIGEPVIGGPDFVHSPFYVVPRSYSGLQNTDPFVFGAFFYTGCQQNTKIGPTQLRYLQQGSVILFGSCIHGRFAIDTVFVVGTFEDHDAKSYKNLRGDLPDAFRDVTLAAWHDARGDADCDRCPPGQSCRLYRGATIDDPFEGMFSFFPCEPASKSPHGFARPVIAIRDIVNPGLLQGKKLNRGMGLPAVKRHWNEVRKQVESAGLWLGVRAATPNRRRTAP